MQIQLVAAETAGMFHSWATAKQQSAWTQSLTLILSWLIAPCFVLDSLATLHKLAAFGFYNGRALCHDSSMCLGNIALSVVLPYIPRCVFERLATSLLTQIWYNSKVGTFQIRLHDMPGCWYNKLCRGELRYTSHHTPNRVAWLTTSVFWVTPDFVHVLSLECVTDYHWDPWTFIEYLNRGFSSKYPPWFSYHRVA